MVPAVIKAVSVKEMLLQSACTSDAQFRAYLDSDSSVFKISDSDSDSSKNSFIPALFSLLDSDSDSSKKWSDSGTDSNSEIGIVHH